MKKLLLIPVALLSFALASSTIAAPTDSASSAIAIKNGEKLAFLGDSITQLGFSRVGGYVNLVISGFNMSGLKVTPIPAGVGGNTSKDMLARIDRDVISKKPDWVTISCGVNDVWHAATGVELEPYKVNMTAMVDKCEAAGIKVMLLTATMIGEDQANPQNQKLIAYNDFVRTLAKEKGCLLADLNAHEQETLKTMQGAAKTNQLTVDGVHMNAFGNQMMASGILSAFSLTENQLQAARGKWDDLPKAMDLGAVSVSVRQYKALETVAAKRGQSVSVLVDAAVAKTVDDLIKGNH